MSRIQLKANSSSCLRVMFADTFHMKIWHDFSFTGTQVLFAMAWSISLVVEAFRVVDQ